MGEFPMRVQAVTASLLVLATLAGCHRAEDANTALGPVIACIVFDCPPAELTSLVRNPRDANQRALADKTPLMFAAGANLAISDRVWKRAGRAPRPTTRVEYVKILLAAGAKVDAFDKSGATALGAAIYNGDPDVVQLLLQARADPNQLTSDMTPLQLAVIHCDGALVRMLLDAGAKLGPHDRTPGESLTELAQIGKCPEVVPATS